MRPCRVRAGPGDELGSLALPPEEHEHFNRTVVDVSHPVRHARVELRGFSGVQHEILVTQHDAQPTAENVDPLETFVAAQVGLGKRVTGRRDHLVSLNSTRTRGERDEYRSVATDHRPVTAVIPGLGDARQLVESHAVRAGQRKQLAQRRPQPSRFKSRQRALGGARDRCELSECQCLPSTQGPQPMPNARKHLRVILVHGPPSFPICNILCTPSVSTARLPGMEPISSAHGQGYDVVVIGGGAAGLSAAIVLARACRSVIVVDAGHSRNEPAKGVHGFLSRDEVPPGELLALGRQELERYGGCLESGNAVAARRSDSGFEVTLETGTLIGARRLMVTSGLTDELPDVPGVRERWGNDVVHCPYCHGWEIRGQAIGVLASGPMATHQALLFRQWTDDLVLFTHTAGPPPPDQAEQLAARGVRIVPGVVERLEITDDRLHGVRMSDGGFIARAAIVVGPRMVAASPVLDSLGLKPVAHPLGSAVGEAYEAGPIGETKVKGVWLAGNVHDIQAQVISSASQGVAAASALNADLIAEETQTAVVRARAQAARPR